MSRAGHYAMVTQNRGQWPSRLHSSAPAVIRGLYPGSDTLRQVCFSCLLSDATWQLWKRHIPYLNHEHCWVLHLKLNLKHSTKIPDISFPPRKISLQTPVRHPTGRQPGCWDPGAPWQQLPLYSRHSNSSGPHKTGFYETTMCWVLGWWLTALCDPGDIQIMRTWSPKRIIFNLWQMCTHTRSSAVQKPPLESSFKGCFFLCFLSLSLSLSIPMVPPSLVSVQRVSFRILHRHRGTSRASHKWPGWAEGPFIFLLFPRGQAPPQHMYPCTHPWTRAAIGQVPPTNYS